MDSERSTSELRLRKLKNWFAQPTKLNNALYSCIFLWWKLSFIPSMIEHSFVRVCLRRAERTILIRFNQHRYFCHYDSLDYICTIFLTGCSQMIKSAPFNFPCPNSCNCLIEERGFSYSGGFTVICKPFNSSSVPEVHPSDTYLEISGRNIEVLDENKFRTIDVLKLEWSQIKRIDKGSFAGNARMTFLTLAGNELETVNFHDFGYLGSQHLNSEYFMEDIFWQ